MSQLNQGRFTCIVVHYYSNIRVVSNNYLSNMPKKYCFATQRGEVCHLTCLMNLRLYKARRDQLKDIKKTYDSHGFWLTKRQWFAKVSRKVSSWHIALSSALRQKGKKANPFLNYINDLKKNSVVLGDIYEKSSLTGNLVKVSETGFYVTHFVTRIFNQLRYPFSLVKIDTMGDYASKIKEAIEVRLPVFRKGDRYFGYHDGSQVYLPLSHSFEPSGSPLEIEATYESVKGPWKVYIKLNESLASRLKDSSNKSSSYFVTNESIFGFDGCLTACDYKKDYKYTFYGTGLAQLIFIALGIDTNNKKIESGHELYEAHNHFKTVMDSVEGNPWSSKNELFTAKNYMLYQLAKLFEKNQLLKLKTSKTVSIFYDILEAYQSLDSAFDSEGKPLSEKKKKLMGENQVLAYAFMHSLRSLYVSAISRKAFIKYFEVQEMSWLFQLPLITGPNQIIRNALNEVTLESGDKISFLSVVKEVLSTLKEDPDVPNQLFDFSGHGSVFDIAPDSLGINHKVNCETPQGQKVFDQLPFVMIDSWCHKEFQAFYSEDLSQHTAAKIKGLSQQLGVDLEHVAKQPGFDIEDMLQFISYETRDPEGFNRLRSQLSAGESSSSMSRNTLS